MNLIVDLGQSGARCKFEDRSLSLDIAKNSNEKVIDTLEQVFKQLPKTNFDKSYLSLTGLQGEVGDERPYGKLCHRYFKSREVAVMDDGIAAFSGAIGDKNGVVLAIGGGVVAISGNQGKFGHADGKGPIFGDFGGGFWVGRTAMSRAISTLDGREEDQEIVDILNDRLKSLSELENKTGIEASTLCIAAARTVIEAAQNGRSSAISILQEGSFYLSRTIQSAWHKVNQETSNIPTVSILGGLAKSEIYVEMILKELGKLMSFEYQIPISDHLTGAIKVADKYPNGIPHLLKWWRA